MFWYSWPSWIVELLGGAVLSGILLAVYHWVYLHKDGRKLQTIMMAVWTGAVISFVYEFILDPNTTIVHRPMVDIGERACGQILGIILYALFVKDLHGSR